MLRIPPGKFVLASGDVAGSHMTIRGIAIRNNEDGTITIRHICGTEHALNCGLIVPISREQLSLDERLFQLSVFTELGLEPTDPFPKPWWWDTRPKNPPGSKRRSHGKSKWRGRRFEKN